MRIVRLSTALGAAVLISMCAPLAAHAADAPPAPAAAPTEEQLDAAKEHFGKGRELYDKGDKKGAVGEFKLAYKLSKNAILLYNVGLVYDELGEKALALHYYEKFLKEAPDNDKTKDNKALSTGRVAVLSKELSADDDDIVAKPAEKPAEKPVEKPAEPVKKPGVTAFTHVTLDEAPPGKPIDLAAQVPDESGWKLSLYFRPQGRDEFTAIKMKPRFQELVGRIPAAELKGQSIQYYIEAKDGSGKLVAQSGSPASPNIVYLEPKAKAHYYREASEVQAEAEAAPKPDENAGAASEGIDEEDPLTAGRKRAEADRNADLGGSTDSSPRDGKVDWVKWGTTGGAAVLLGTSIGLYISAQSYADKFEADAGRDCDGKTCPFDSYAASLQSKGESMELWSNITLGAGVVTAGVAGYFWYKDLRRPKHRSEPTRAPDSDEEASVGSRFMAAPLLAPGVIGGAAVFQF